MAKTTRPKTEIKDDVTKAVDASDPVVMAEPTFSQPEPEQIVAPVEDEIPPAAEPTADPVSEPSQDMPPPDQPPPPAIPATEPPKRSSGFVGMVAGGVIAAALGYGVATYFPIPGLLDRTGQAAQTESTLASLANRIGALESAPAPAVDAALSDRVQALEQRTAPDMPDLAPLIAAIAALDARLNALESAPRTAITAEGGPVSPDLAAAVEALRAEVEGLKGSGESVSAKIAAAAADANARLAEAEAQAAQLKAEAEETARKSMARAAVGRLQASLESGVPFASALENLSGLDVSASLVAVAETGVPTQSALEAAFPPAARAALEASLKADMGASWSERLGSFLQSTTGARSLTPREGTDPDAVLSRAEAALKKRDLEAALNELTGLPPEGQAAMSDFVAMANQRRAAITDINTLSSAIEE